MKNQIPEIKLSSAKRLSPDLDEILHMLKSLEGADRTQTTPRQAQ